MRGRRPTLFPLVCALLLCLGAAPAGPAAIAAARALATAALPSPADLFGPLFVRVQLARIFSDQKSFADAVPKRDPAAILRAWRAGGAVSDPAGLRRFIRENFTLPAPASDTPAPQPDGRLGVGKPVPIARHIAALWPQLVRTSPIAAGSALALPRPFVVPGGRFRELYYWDSYFTLLGLVADGQMGLARDMIGDFESLIARYGHVPNGSRTYYLSRSQPPFFYAMLGMVPAAGQADQRARLAAMLAEYGYWMAADGPLAPGSARLHRVAMPDGTILNRYDAGRRTPRDESYALDVVLAARSHQQPARLYANLRAAAESGWDFSSRWLGDGRDLSTIDTTDLVEPDLNALLYGEELAIAAARARLGDAAGAAAFRAAAARRKAAMRRYLWDPDSGIFRDWNWKRGKFSPVASAATLYPLFTGAADMDQAARIAAYVQAHLLAPGGLRTTAIDSGQQWDAPNGWAPLQWIAYVGLRRFGEARLARTIACRWRATVEGAYAQTGKLVEKYDVEARRFGGGGEYRLQDGFGWTNGVERALAPVRCGGNDLASAG